MKRQSSTTSEPLDVNLVGGSVTVTGGLTDAELRASPLVVRGGFSLGVYDYVSMALSAGDTTETYVFKSGGSGGTTVATVTVVYTSSAREVLVSVTKT